jgi:hypothetical protein
MKLYEGANSPEAGGVLVECRKLDPCRSRTSPPVSTCGTQRVPVGPQSPGTRATGPRES